MGYHRPKILTAITVPTGGWAFQFKISDAGSLDTTCNITVPAGTYYIAWDAQSDDLLYVLNGLMRQEVIAELAGANRYATVSMNSDNKVVFTFLGTNFTGAFGQDVSLDWTASSADLAAALGFYSDADDVSTGVDNPIFTADHQHAYGWYASDDGQLESLLVEDVHIPTSPQAMAYTGQLATQHLGARYSNVMVLNWLTRNQTRSGSTEYGAATPYPYPRNVGLESWWLRAMVGTRFRVYREGRNDSSNPVGRGTGDVNDMATAGDSSKSWDVLPWQQYAGMVWHIDDRAAGVSVTPGRFLIASHTATVLTAANSTNDGRNWHPTGLSDDTFYILDQRYQTYKLDLGKMREFAPTELPNIDRYGITIPLLRYEA